MIAGSFQRVIVPEKIPAIVDAESESVLRDGRLCKIPIGAATTGTWMMLARLVDAVCAASENQKSPTDLSELVRPAPEPDEAYVNEWPEVVANGALQASIRSAGKDAPEP